MNDFPEHEGDIYRCPWCSVLTSAGEVKEQQSNAQASKKDRQINVKYACCRTCGLPVTRVMGSKTHSYAADSTIFPKATIRGRAPAEVRDLDKFLADTYDEAVACEPHSAQAGIYLLGRCVEWILLTKATPAATGEGEDTGKPKESPGLADLIKKRSNQIPEFLREPLMDAFRPARNQTGHIWLDEVCKPISADAETSDSCFAIVESLFQHFYIAEKKRAEFIAKMAGKNAGRGTPSSSTADSPSPAMT